MKLQHTFALGVIVHGLSGAAALPAYASTSIFKDKWIDATMECIAYASQVNCDKAYGAARAYERSLQNVPGAIGCASLAGSTGTIATILPTVGTKADLQDSLQGSIESCEKF